MPALQLHPRQGQGRLGRRCGGAGTAPVPQVPADAPGIAAEAGPGVPSCCGHLRSEPAGGSLPPSPSDFKTHTQTKQRGQQGCTGLSGLHSPGLPHHAGWGVLTQTEGLRLAHTGIPFTMELPGASHTASRLDLRVALQVGRRLLCRAEGVPPETGAQTG